MAGTKPVVEDLAVAESRVTQIIHWDPGDAPSLKVVPSID
jgi:hypothetical protein